MGEGQQDGEGARVIALPTPKKPRSELQQAATLRAGALGREAQNARRVASLGDGGFLNRRSSPFVFWLADRLREQG